MINKKRLPDGRVVVSLFCDPDVANDLFLLAKQKNIEIAEESPIIDEKILQNLNKTAGKDIAIQKIEKMADDINHKNRKLNKLLNDVDVMVERYLKQNPKK